MSDQIATKRKTSPTVLPCQVCKVRSCQYTCPRCYVQTCSVQCCRLHKAEQNCNGKRDHTKYVALSSMNDATILSDYQFIQNGTQHVDTGRRLWNTMIHDKDHNNNNHQNHKKRPRCNTPAEVLSDLTHEKTVHPILQRSLIEEVDDQQQQQQQRGNFDSYNRHNNRKIAFIPQTVAKMNQIHLLILPKMMERHQINHSSYQLPKTRNTTPRTTAPTHVLHWTLELCFITPVSDAAHRESDLPYSTSTILLHAVRDTITVCELLKQAVVHLKQQEQEQNRLRAKSMKGQQDINTTSPFWIKNFPSDDGDDVSITEETVHLVWLMKNIPCPAHRPTFIEVATTTVRTSTGTLNDIDKGCAKTLHEVLRHRTVIEFPTIYVMLQQDYVTAPLCTSFPCIE
jgi:hypothetical protein